MEQLTPSDKQRIEQEAWQWIGTPEGESAYDGGNQGQLECFNAGAEYATIFERQQQQLPPDNETVEDGGGCYVAGSREVEAERTEKVTDLLAKVSEQEKEIAELKAERQELLEGIRIRVDFMPKQLQKFFRALLDDKFNHSKP